MRQHNNIQPNPAAVRDSPPHTFSRYPEGTNEVFTDFVSMPMGKKFVITDHIEKELVNTFVKLCKHFIDFDSFKAWDFQLEFTNDFSAVKKITHPRVYYSTFKNKN